MQLQQAKYIAQQVFHHLGPACERFNKVNHWPKIKGEPTGRYTQRMLPEDIKLELSIARKENFGYLVAIRTGSFEFSHKLAKRWCKLGFNGDGGMLTDQGKPIPIYEESELFSILGLEYIHPKDRS